MSNERSKKKPYSWVKISAVSVGCLSLLAFESYVFTSMPSATKYKVYRFQFAIVLNLVFYVGSKYFWKRLVTDVVKSSTPTLMQYPWKCMVLLYLFLAHFSPFTNYLVSQEPSLLNMASWTCFGSYILLFFILAPLSVFVKFLNKISKKKMLSRRKQSLLAVLATAIYTWMALEVASSAPEIVSVEIPIAHLPKSMDRMRIALICDIHLGPTVGFTQLNRVVKMTNDLKPDVVAFAGDLMDITVDDADGIAMPLADLKAPYGKYFVTGNHEYYTGDVENWLNLLEQYGFTILHNSNKKVHSKTNEKDWFCMIGTDDIQANQIRYEGHGMDLAKAYDGCDADHASILIAHQPKAAKFAMESEFNIQLVLSGHTHGGQMYPIIWLAYFINPYLRGLYQHDSDRYVYVSQGSVYYGFPLRLGSKPEITHITLRST